MQRQSCKITQRHVCNDRQPDVEQAGTTHSKYLLGHITLVSLLVEKLILWHPVVDGLGLSIHSCLFGVKLLYS